MQCHEGGGIGSKNPLLHKYVGEFDDAMGVFELAVPAEFDAFGGEQAAFSGNVRAMALAGKASEGEL